MSNKVVVTGASGLLGSAVFNAFVGSPSTVLGLAHTKPSAGMESLDLIEYDAVTERLRRFFQEGEGEKKWVIHCAAESRPTQAELEPERTKKINVDVPAHLARLSQELGYTLIYISTDYVFDGTSPPYKPDSLPNPLQTYGKMKRAGEEAVLPMGGVVMRLPVLYGPIGRLYSAINSLLDVVRDQSGRMYRMDHYATRFPTNVVDVASFLVRLVASSPRVLPPIIHYSAGEPYTKYEMCLVFARVLGVRHGHIVPDTTEPKGAANPTRPKNSQLDVTETEALCIEGGLGCGGFEEWFEKYLAPNA